MARPRVGPFVIDAPLGAGGMGEVWRGTHAPSGAPVAVKVLTHQLARRPDFLSAFEREVHALATLDHPAIVAVYDRGRVDPAAAQASGGRLAEGAPYLVMELREGAPSPDALAPWPAVRARLALALDALAFAHARGVLHRDLKPGNVLLGPGGAPCLIDFGLAHLARRVAQGEAPGAGYTAGWSAPEQIVPWRRGEQGPATDLYALGCLAFAWSCGRAPFDDPTPEARALRQVQGPAPMLPRGCIPEQAAAWIAWLMAGDAALRPQSAAEALAALPGSPSPRGPRALVGAARAHPPLPAHPPEPPGARPGGPMEGAGLGLFGLRLPPMIGRDDERAALWAALREVCGGGGPRAVALTGLAGVGKSRLGAWIAEVAHRAAGLPWLEVVHGPHPAAHTGLRGAFSRVVGCEGLPRGEAAPRVRAWCRGRGVGEAADALLGLLYPEAPPSGEPPQATQRALPAVLGAVGRGRPLVWVVDDVQWGADALALASQVLREGGPPVLAVLTAREELLAERPVERQGLEAALASPGARRIPVEPLPPGQHLRLVRAQLPLSLPLAERVAGRTAGHPLFAVQLVGDWALRGLLLPGAEGFTLGAGEASPLPDSIHGLWAERLSRAVGDPTAPTPARLGLEIAAALGRAVDGAEWRRGCDAAGLALPDSWLPSLISAHLLRPEEGGFSFIHSTLQESLRREAEEAGRWGDANLACALALDAAPGDPDRDERRAHHLLAAGRPEEALPPLLRAAAGLRDTGRLRRALGAAQLWEATSAALGRRGAALIPGLMCRAETLATQGALAEAEDALREVAAVARAAGARLELATAQWVRGQVAARRGQIEVARGHLAAALDDYEALADGRGIANTRHALGELDQAVGALAAAVAHYEAALPFFEGLGDGLGAGKCLSGLAQASLRLGDLGAADAYNARVLACHEATGSPMGVAIALNDMGDVARARGALSDAEALYARAALALGEMGSAYAPIPQLNRAGILLRQGRVDAAGPLVRDALARLEATGLRGFSGCAHLLLLQIDGEAFDAHLTQGLAHLSAAAFVDEDVAWAAEAAAPLARARGDGGAAELLDALARDQRRALGGTMGRAIGGSRGGGG